MPESKSRKKPAYVPPPAPGASVRRPSPRWWAPVMLGLMLLGLVWIVVTYMSESQYPVPDIGGAWNLGIGFAIAMIGFAMTTRWR